MAYNPKAKHSKNAYSTADIIKAGSTFQMPDDIQELEKVYHRLAKSADQRLVRLEKAAEEENYGHATEWAYARAMRDIKAWSGDEAKRFNTAPPKTKAQLLAKIEDIKTFLEAPTSTKKGIKATLQKRANTLNERYGTDFSWNDVGTFFESKLHDKIDFNMSSSTKLKAIGKIMKNADDIEKELEKKKKQHRKIALDPKLSPDDKDAFVNMEIDNILQNYGPEVLKFLQENK